MKNKYAKSSKISEAKIRKIIEFFSLDINATKTSKSLYLSRQTITNYFDKFRQIIFLYSKSEDTTKILEESELDDTRFGSPKLEEKDCNVKDNATRVPPTFGLLKKDGKIHITVIKNCSKQNLLPVVNGELLEGSTIYADGWTGYDNFMSNGYNHYRIYPANNQSTTPKYHITDMESFWSYCKKRLAKFKGIKEDKFLLHLKECEYRFNHRNENLYKSMLKLIRTNIALLD